MWYSKCSDDSRTFIGGESSFRMGPPRPGRENKHFGPNNRKPNKHFQINISSYSSQQIRKRLCLSLSAWLASENNSPDSILQKNLGSFLLNKHMLKCLLITTSVIIRCLSLLDSLYWCKFSGLEWYVNFKYENIFD